MASGAVKKGKVDGSTATTPEGLDRKKLSFKPICISSTASSGLVPVTFDNNGDQNYWSYHTKDSNYSNVSELFHMEYVGQTDVKILGYLPPPTSDRRAVAWYLTIRENANGSTASYPTFAPQLLESGETILHTEYTKHDNPNTIVNTFGLSFKTQNGRTYYLVPYHGQKRMGVSSSAQYPFFVGETGTRCSLVQISVDNGNKVTFDDCGNRNYWSYHSPGNFPNVSELFEMSIKEGKAVISGYPLAPKRGRQVKWFLKIREGRTGVLEEYPRFLSEWIHINNTEVEPVIQTEMEITEEYQVTTEDCTDSENKTIFHKDFDWQDSPDPDRNWHFGLSFRTRNRGTGNITYYLVPDSREKNHITISEVPAYPFTKHEPDRVGWTNIVT